MLAEYGIAAGGHRSGGGSASSADWSSWVSGDPTTAFVAIGVIAVGIYVFFLR